MGIALSIMQKTIIFNIIKHDFVSFLLFIAPIVILGMHLYLMFFGELSLFRFGRERQLTYSEADNMFFYLGVVLLIIFVPLLIKRVKFVYSVITRGEKVSGLMIDSFFMRDRGTLMYQYKYKNRSYSVVNRVMKTERTNQFKNNQRVTILFNPHAPTQAFIGEVYL